MIDLGTTYRATCTVTQPDINGVAQLADAATQVCTITLPDATTATPLVVHDSTGRYHADYVTTAAGLHQVTWTTTTPGTATADVFNVRQFTSIIGLAEAKAHLNMTAVADDDELRNFLAAATELVEAKAGACVRRTVVERVSEGGYQLVLSRRPVISVESVKSVWPSGPGWTTAQLLLDGEAGIVHQTYMWMFWYGPWDVNYTIGRAVMPERYIHAAKEQVRHLWETQRGAVQAPPLAGEEVFTTAAGFSFSVPRRVIELLADDMVPAI
jgi:hypothetical protein